jgi:hypothetical protein
MNEIDECLKIKGSVHKLFNPKERDINEIKTLLEEDSDSDDVGLELSMLKMPSMEKLDRQFEDWSPG